MEKTHHPSLLLNLLSPKPSLSQSRFPSQPPWAGGDVQSLPVALQKGVFIQFDCCYYVAKLSIKVVIYEMCVAAVVSSFSCFLHVLLLLLFLLLCHLSGREKPGLIISWHILCALRMSAVGLAGSCFSGGFLPLLLLPAAPPPPPPLHRQRPCSILQAGDKGEAGRWGWGVGGGPRVALGPLPSSAAACPQPCQLLIAE